MATIRSPLLYSSYGFNIISPCVDRPLIIKVSYFYEGPRRLQLNRDNEEIECKDINKELKSQLAAIKAHQKEMAEMTEMTEMAEMALIYANPSTFAQPTESNSKLAQNDYIDFGTTIVGGHC